MAQSVSKFSVGSKVVATRDILTYFQGSEMIDAREGDKGEVIESLSNGAYNVQFPECVTLVFDDDLDFIQ